MNKHEININVSNHVFDGLSKQGLLAAQATCELVDNAIAAAGSKGVARVQIIMEDRDDLVNLYVMDWGCGMDLPALEKAMQLGSTPDSDSRLNEHGFGIKNSLSSLSGGKRDWRIQTRIANGTVYRIQSPFALKMLVTESEAMELPKGTMALWGNPSTVVQVSVSKTYLQTLRGCGGKAMDVLRLRKWLVEHLGVAYRGYLELNPATMESDAKIAVTVDSDTVWVPPVYVPYAAKKLVRFEVLLGGQKVIAEYHFGVLDKAKRDVLVGGDKARYYYQGNQKTQGIDIRLGKRVIATAQLERIWCGSAGQELVRHNCYNDFVGELILPELPRGVLPTLNNKTGVDEMDEGWQSILEQLASYPPLKSIRSTTEQGLQSKWAELLKATCPGDSVSCERTVWPCGTRIDVYQEAGDKLVVYELKAGKAEPLNLYQLKMYWDGLVLQGQQPTEGVLLVQEYASTMEQMCALMNAMPAPLLPDGTASAPYHFTLATHEEKCLVPRKDAA